MTRKRSAPRRRPVDAPLDEERQERGAGAERRRQQVVGVQVAHRGEDVGQLAVELDLRSPGLLGQRGEPVAQQPQPLHRVDRVHRPLEHEVDVALLDHHQRLVDEQQAVGQRERAVAHATEEVAEQRSLGGAGRRLGQHGRCGRSRRRRRGPRGRRAPRAPPAPPGAHRGGLRRYRRASPLITSHGLGGEVGHAGQAVGVRLVVDDRQRVELQRAEHLGQRLGGAERGQADRPAVAAPVGGEHVQPPERRAVAHAVELVVVELEEPHAGAGAVAGAEDGASRDRVLQRPGQLGQGR